MIFGLVLIFCFPLVVDWIYMVGYRNGYKDCELKQKNITEAAKTIRVALRTLERRRR